jgi:OOP family OmpA-OmpF porin
MRTLLLITVCLLLTVTQLWAQKEPKKPANSRSNEKLPSPDMSVIYGKQNTPELEKKSVKDTVNIIPPSSYSRFSAGLNYGISFYSGDVPADAIFPGYGGFVKYSFSHVMGFRAQYLHGKLSGGPTVADPIYNSWFTTNVNTWNLQFLLNIGTVDFRKSFPRDNFYLGFGGAFQYLNGQRENADTAGNLLKYKERIFSVPLSVGYKRKVSRNIDVGLEATYLLGASDQLDLLVSPIRPSESNGYLTATVTYNITTAKKPKHIDWYNPIDKIYRDIEKTKDDMEAMKVDDDNDGVPNMMDQELDTKAGYKVDNKGVTLDSDEDGVPDTEDPDPYGFGKTVGLYFPAGLGGADTNETIYKINDSIPKTEFVTISRSGFGLPTITFPPNHFTVHVEQYNVLQQIARILMVDTAASVVIIGHADNNKPNMTQLTLSERRALEVKRRLYKIYEIEEERMLVFSEKDPYVQRYQMASEGLDRKVEFRIIRPVQKRQPRVDKEDMRKKEEERAKDPDLDRGY